MTRRSRFFLFNSLLFLLAAIAGFLPSLQRSFDNGISQVPWVIHFHGITMMGWLVVACIQAELMQKNARKWHIRLGLAGVLLFIAVWFSSFGLSTNTLFWEVPTEARQQVYNIYGLSVLSLILMAFFYAGAMLALARHPQAHKRFILLTSLALIDAAIFRMTWLPILPFAAPEMLNYSFYHLLLLVPLVVFDWRQLGRLHWATLIGVVSFILAKVIAFIMWDAAFWYQWVEKLRQALASSWLPLY